MDMTANLINVTEDLGWATMVDVGEFVTTYGSMVLAAGLDRREMECWMAFQRAVIHYQMPRVLSEEDEASFKDASARASRDFGEFCKLATAMLGEKMAIPSWHQVSSHHRLWCGI